LQFIQSDYLCDPREFAEQYTGAGFTNRLPVAGPPGGPHGQYTYQITKHDIAEIDKVLIERLKRAFWKAVEERSGVAVAVSATAVVTWLLTRFGLNR
jgi:hypothetical protein